MSSPAEVFKQEVLDDHAITDPRGIHHVFPDGKHGRRLDLEDERLGDTPTILIDEIKILASRFQELYQPESVEHIALVGVAKKTNRAVGPVSRILEGRGYRVDAYNTQQGDNGDLQLTPLSEEKVRSQIPKLAVVIGGVAIEGETEAEAAELVSVAGVDRVEVLVVWQRSESLPGLEAANIDYEAIIKESNAMAVYGNAMCRAAGFCYRGDRLIRGGQNH